MDPYSVTIWLFFKYFYNTFSYHHANLDLPSGVEPFLLKALREGFKSVNTISALFFLCTGQAVGKRDCCFLCRHSSVQYLTSIFFFVFTSLLPFAQCPFTYLRKGGKPWSVLLWRPVSWDIMLRVGNSNVLSRCGLQSHKAGASDREPEDKTTNYSKSIIDYPLAADPRSFVT